MKNILIIISLFMFSVFAQSKPGDGTLPVLRSLQIHTIQGPMHLPKVINLAINESLKKDKVIVKKIKTGNELEKISISLNLRNEVDIKIESELNANFQYLNMRPISQDNFLSKSLLGEILIEREIILIWE